MTTRTASVYIGLLCVGVVVFLLFYLRPLVLLAHVRREFRDSPEIWIVPKPLISAPIASPTAKSSVVSYFGYQFEAPTPEVKEEPRPENVVVLSFADCARMVILKPQPRGPLTGLMHQMPPNATRFLEEVYGKKAVRSDYEFRRTILNMTPNDLSALASPRQIVRNSILLTLKGADSQRFKNGLYSFETAEMRGFQEGILALDRGVVIQAFDHQDHLLTLIVLMEKGQVCFGQPELNHIIFSLRPAPVSE
ncbi:MAG TPA: hypothetical protein VKP61_05950 [Candidatus Acidoferrum sp.]|nr:hypothetical protein [Candidatus Acidoferrum sp.]